MDARHSVKGSGRREQCGGRYLSSLHGGWVKSRMTEKEGEYKVEKRCDIVIGQKKSRGEGGKSAAQRKGEWDEHFKENRDGQGRGIAAT